MTNNSGETLRSGATEDEWRPREELAQDGSSYDPPSWAVDEVGVREIAIALTQADAEQICRDHTAARAGRALVKYVSHDTRQGCFVDIVDARDPNCRCGLQSALDAINQGRE